MKEEEKKERFFKLSHLSRGRLVPIPKHIGLDDIQTPIFRLLDEIRPHLENRKKEKKKKRKKKENRIAQRMSGTWEPRKLHFLEEREGRTSGVPLG